MKKPEIPDTTTPPSKEWLDAVKGNIVVLTGRRNNKLTTATAAVAAPTQAEFNALVTIVNALISRLDS